MSGKCWMLVLLLVAGTLHGAEQPVASSLTTAERLESPGWWPTKGEAAQNEYAGDEACSTCHAGIAAAQQTTPMFHAGVRAAQSQIPGGHDDLAFQEASFHYVLKRNAGGVSFSVTDGTNSKATTAVWAFGAGVIGQTYILQKGDAYLESRLSYFTRLSALDITIGHSPDAPASLEGALGHAMDTPTTQLCFGCHTTGAVIENVFAPEQANPGVHCEACHGPGARHVAAMKAKKFAQVSATIFNPAHLAASDSVDYCGACHRSWADVVMRSSPTGIGINTVRFQPYLLENSRCWGKGGDARITCIACHDPHQPLVKEAVAYDAKCLACHTAPQHVCKVGTNQCTTCHMPKYELPQSHAIFTDHTIRVVRTADGKNAP